MRSKKEAGPKGQPAQLSVNSSYVVISDLSGMPLATMRRNSDD
jgi:hypothetical protein